MTHPRPGHLLCALFLVAMILAPHAMWAQDDDNAMEVQQTPSELYRDVIFLRVITVLELTENQVGKVIPIARQVADQLIADEDADAQAYEEVSDAADAVIGSLLGGQNPPEVQLGLLNAAVNARMERERFRATLVGQAAAAIQRTLTAEQAAKIETAAEQLAREQTQARLGGAETPVDYIVARLEAQTKLMPDEYVRTREARAVQMAETLLGRDAQGVRSMAVGLLQVMNEVAAWTADENANRRPTLAKDIRALAGLPEEPLTHEVKHDEFLEWITAEGAITNLETWLITRAMQNRSLVGGEEDGQ